MANMEDPAVVLDYNELYSRVVPVELRSFPSSNLLNKLFQSNACPSGLKDLYADLLDSPETPSKASTASGGVNNAPVPTSASAGVEMMKVRVLSHSVGGAMTSMRVELSCDSSLFFHYAANISAGAFEDIKEDCNLVVDFPAFPALVLKLLNLLVEQPTTYLALLVLRADGSAVLEFAQNLDFKCMSLLSMRVEAVPQAMVRGYVTMRHNALVDRCAELEAELFELRSLVTRTSRLLLLLLFAHHTLPGKNYQCLTMPPGNRRPLYEADDLPAVDEQPAQQTAAQLGPLPVPLAPALPDSTFKQPCTLKGLSAGLYAGALGYFLGFVPATFKFKAKQWGMIHSQGMASASQLALMSGMYTAVHCICQRIRMVEDGWNRGLAGCSTGLVLGWKTGPWGALQSCVSLGLLSALIDFGGGAVEAAEAAALHQLQELQDKQQQLQCEQNVLVSDLLQSNSQMANVCGQALSFVRDPCALLVRLQQQPIHVSSASGHAGQQQHNQQLLQKPSLALPSAVEAAVQQLQQFVGAPPLMFLGACCHSSSSHSSQKGPLDGANWQAVDACELNPKTVSAAVAGKRGR